MLVCLPYDFKKPIQVIDVRYVGEELSMVRCMLPKIVSREGYVTQIITHIIKISPNCLEIIIKLKLYIYDIRNWLYIM